MQAISLVAGYSRRIEAIKNSWNFDKLPAVACGRSEVLKLSKEEYQTWADPIVRGFEEAARFLYSQKIFDADDLAYPIQLVALSAIFTVLGERSRSEQVRSAIGCWLWLGMLGEIYTRWQETQAGRDIVEVPNWLAGGSLPSTITQANISVDRLLSIRKRYGAFYQGLAALLRREGAIDLSTGEEINDVIYFEELINCHHIFLIAWCRKQGIDPKRYNCLVNRTPLSAKTNRQIGSKAPSAYLREFELLGTSARRHSEVAAKAEQKIPGFKEGQAKYAKDYRVNIHRWSYGRAIDNIKSQAAKAGITVEIGLQPLQGSPQEKARDLAIAAYQSRQLL